MLQVFANATLRTLCLSYKDITTAEFDTWSRAHKEAKVAMSDREGALDRVYEQIESNMMVSGKQRTFLVCFFLPIFAVYLERGVCSILGIYQQKWNLIFMFS